ncbi:MAG: DinB family protein [Candidatus Sumerlaeota bacterium]
MLVRHIAFAELHWVGNVTGHRISAELKEQTRSGGQDPASGDLPQSDLTTVEELIALRRAVREDFTVPAVADIEDIDHAVQLGDKEATLRGILINQLWHWTYHSGQVGLLRRMTGQRYQWRYGKEIKAPGAHQ